jgi:UDP-N-acetylmuramoyl-tripeptide--D-alanyl-D-alanine ligase
MLEALAQVQPVGDRGRVLRFGPHLLIADCYNANPGSVAAALRSLAGLRGRRTGPLVAVLGDMLELGPTAPQLHAEVGALAAELGSTRCSPSGRCRSTPRRRRARRDRGVARG